MQSACSQPRGHEGVSEVGRVIRGDEFAPRASDSPVDGNDGPGGVFSLPGRAREARVVPIPVLKRGVVRLHSATLWERG